MSKQLTMWRRALHSTAVTRRIATQADFFAHGYTSQLYPQSQREILVFFGGLFPMLGPLSRFLPSPSYSVSPTSSELNTETNSDASDDVINAPALKKELPFKPMTVVPRRAEGGAFVKYQLPPGVSQEEAILQLDKEVKPQSFLGYSLPTRAYAVSGHPWINDMPVNLSYTVLVSGAKVEPEEVFTLLRPYGPINSLRAESGVVKVRFGNLASAIAARNCIHGLKLSDGQVQVKFAARNKAVVRSWISDHPRVSGPILITLLLALAYAIFEPVREFSIRQRIKGTWNLRNYQVVKFLTSTLPFSISSSLGQFYPGYSSASGADSDWALDSSRSETVKALTTTLSEAPNTFIILSGPRGSGKRRVVQETLKETKRESLVLTLDCDLLNATSGNVGASSGSNNARPTTVLAGMLGYWPAFLFMGSFSRLLDLAIQSVTGQPGGFSESSEEQVQRMLSSADAACRQLALGGDSHSDPSSGEPSTKPVIILEGWAQGGVFAQPLAAWAGRLASSGNAQVIIVTHDAGFDRALSLALPNRVFSVIEVGDADLATARLDVLRFCQRAAAGKEPNDPANLAVAAVQQMDDAQLRPLGGRLTDLQAYSRRLLTGENADVALSALIHQGAVEVSQLFLTGSHPEWTPEQVWLLIKTLGNTDADTWVSVPAKLGLDPVFADAEATAAVFGALESRELIQTRSIGGRITGVRAGRPLYQAAFAALADDPLVSGIQESMLLKFYINGAQTAITKGEAELQSLALLPKKYETQLRQDYLLKNLEAAQLKIGVWDTKRREILSKLQPAAGASKFN